jgi:hypothetical protein
VENRVNTRGLVSNHRVLTVLVSVLALSVLGPAAHAQVPPVPVPSPSVPPTPTLPPEVQNAVDDALITALSPAYTAAHAAMPAATAVGFALRPGCATIDLSGVATGLASGLVQLPVPLVLVLGPALILCYAAGQPGPADPVFQQADYAAGPTLADLYNSAVDQVITPIRSAVPGLVRAELSPTCLVAVLVAGVPAALPPPSNRVDLSRAACL